MDLLSTPSATPIQQTLIGDPGQPAESGFKALPEASNVRVDLTSSERLFQRIGATAKKDSSHH